MTCRNCDSLKIENRDLMLCGTCNKLNRKRDTQIVKEVTPIKKVSDKQAILDRKYLAKRAKWIKGKMCAVFPKEKATECHHMAGRVGYHDEWARDNEMPLLLDERFWLPVSEAGHKKITNNPKWASENKFTFLRVTDPVFRKQIN